jgi:hypothetical protein
MMTEAGRHQRHDLVVVCHDVVLADIQFEIKNVEEFALDPTNITLAKDACAHSPVHVLKRRVIQVLRKRGGTRVSHT